MAEHVLVTGGMGFIGRRVVAELQSRGARVRVLDSMNEQVHGEASNPTDVAAEADIELQIGDIRDADAVSAALEGVDAVVHLAAEVGVGQSMYEIERYTAVNELGTAVLFQQMLKRPIRRIVTASSMSIYGEGLYRDSSGGLVEDARRVSAVDGGVQWDPVDANGGALQPIPTPEWKRPTLSSVYALNKYAQEQMTLIVPPAYGVESVALRLFNVFGPGQALSNPYTGVLAIFAARLLNGRAPMIFEDGEQQRDFVHVNDVARAFADALEKPGLSGEVMNIGSGSPISIGDLARRFAAVMGREDLAPDITRKVRTGDIRHCFADIAKAEALLGYRPRQNLDDGLAKLADWVRTQKADDRVDAASSELAARGLVT
jgi:dTDP-L-rhamnose 4-epimerase